MPLSGLKFDRALAPGVNPRRPQDFVRSLRELGIALAFLTIAGPLQSQQPVRHTATPASVIAFTLDFPESNPSHYSIAVDSAGHATYECQVRIEDNPEAQSYKTEFEMSAGDRDRIFDWAKQAHYFSGKIDSGKNVAFTGSKTLSYQDGKLSNTARYNYSTVVPVQRLTALLQNVAGTLEYGRRLAYYYQFQKLALDDELKRMQTQARNSELSEIQSVAPVLREIVEDTSVINMVRSRARELLLMGDTEAAKR